MTDATMRTIIDGLKRNNVYLNYDLEKTRLWAIANGKESEKLKEELAAMKNELAAMKKEVEKIHTENAKLRLENAQLHIIVEGL